MVAPVLPGMLGCGRRPASWAVSAVRSRTNSSGWLARRAFIAVMVAGSRSPASGRAPGAAGPRAGHRGAGAPAQHAVGQQQGDPDEVI